MASVWLKLYSAGMVKKTEAAYLPLNRVHYNKAQHIPLFSSVAQPRKYCPEQQIQQESVRTAQTSSTQAAVRKNLSSARRLSASCLH